MKMPTEHQGLVNPAIRVGDTAHIDGMSLVVTGRREMAPDRYGNVAELEFVKAGGRKRFWGGVKENGFGWAISDLSRGR